MPMPWPDALPQRFDKDGYSDSFADNRQNTQTDLGPALIRSRISSMPRKIAGVMKMNKTQLDRLRQFWKVDTLDGKLPFLFPDPVFGYGERKNWIPNSGYAGAVAGNPGTPPNGWSGVGTQNGISKFIQSMGYEGNLQYVDLHFAGTPSGGGAAEIIFATSIPSVSGQVWTESLYARMVAGDKTNLTAIRLRIHSLPNVMTVETDILTQLSSAELAHQRYSNSGVLSSSGQTGVTPRIMVAGTLGIFIDITIRVAGIQMEKTDRPTAFMPTPNTATPITRFAAGGRPPSPIFLGGVTWGVQMEMEIFET